MEIQKNCPYCFKCHNCNIVQINKLGACPICGGELLPDTKGHMYVNTKKRLYHCKRCDSSGWLDPDMILKKYKKKVPQIKDIDLFTFHITGNKIAQGIFNYAMGRLRRPIITHYCRWSPQLPNRIVFPVYSEGKLIGLNARTIFSDGKPKYISYGPISKMVFRFDEVDNWAVITEGPFDALATPHGICTFGKKVSETQCLLLASKYDTIYIGLDSDAESTTRELERRLKKLKVKVYRLELLEGKDPADLKYKGMEKLIREANNGR